MNVLILISANGLVEYRNDNIISIRMYFAKSKIFSLIRKSKRSLNSFVEQKNCFERIHLIWLVDRLQV